MQEPEWHELRKIFDEVVELPADQRADAVERLCGTRWELRRSVASLLAAHEDPDGLPLEPETALRSEASSDTGLCPGDTVDRYRILQCIGEGGFGVVYMAEQLEPVRRRVALKVIKLGMDTKEVVTRFEAERQALAVMDHPNIARVFDGGATVEGRPYFVMELVHGVPLTQYCDDNRLGVEERVRLLADICGAVQHAHQKGVIHRDLKPTNVLVTLHDGVPVPKVIDFGIAKAIDRRLTERTLFTAFGQFVGTPEYMSPEQAEMSGLDVDTRSDIYSLGVLLYELLTGTTPHRAETLRRMAYAEWAAFIRETEPERPSTRISGLGDRSVELARRHGVNASDLVRSVRGELDWIVMRCLEKDRTRRYGTASEVAADILRYVRKEPVLARAPSTAYRVRKFVRRHRAGVGLTAASIVILTTVAVVMTLQAGRIARERDRAHTEARRNRAAAEVFQALLLEDTGLLADSSSTYVADRAREAWELHRGSLTDDPAELSLYAVNLLVGLDLNDAFGSGDKSAVRQLKTELERETVDLIRRAIAEGDTSVFGAAELMIARLEERERESAIESGVVTRLQRDVVNLRREVHVPGEQRLAQSLVRFAEHLEGKARRALAEGRAADAEPMLRELLRVRFEVHPPGSGWTWFPAIAKGLLGQSLMKLGRHVEAEPLLLESLDVLDTRDVRLHVIALYESWGKPAEAERYREDLWVESIREMGPVGTPEVRNMELGSSCLFVDRSVWVFRDWFVHSMAPAGGAHRPNRWAWTDDPDASDGIRLYEPALVPGRDRELLPWTVEERAFNDAHTVAPVERWVLWPGPVITDPDRHRALVVYTKVLALAENSRRDHVGTSLAIWEHPDSTVVRPVVRPGAEYPTLLFQGDEPELGAGAVSDGAYLYLYASRCRGLDCGTIVARAPLSDVLDRSAWRFYAGEDKWASEWRDAVSVLDSALDLSVHWNDYLGKYLAVHSPAPGSGVAIRMADRPEGPWSSHRSVLDGVPAPDRRTNRLARAHPEFARDGGRTEYVTYYHPTAAFQSEVRLVEVTFR